MTKKRWGSLGKVLSPGGQRRERRFASVPEKRKIKHGETEGSYQGREEDGVQKKGNEQRKKKCTGGRMGRKPKS